MGLLLKGEKTCQEQICGADFKLKLTCNTDLPYHFGDMCFLEGQNFGFWGSLGVPLPKGEKICLGQI